MKTVILSAFKARCIALLREAQRTAEPIVVTRRGRPLARIEPIREPVPKRVFGKQRGRMTIKGDIVHADFAAEWEAGS
ncbi:type II toxin-antitoxin system Phd/YefM family antitoxin [bacterium]|nr:type II toxin-antitoxin system Phd/YefM family antitoxin [bacterium]